MGDIGPLIKEVEIEPIPTDIPVTEPSPAPAREDVPV